MTLEFRKTLMLTTGHLTEATAKMLDTTPAKDWPVIGGPYGTYGWQMYAHDDNDGTIPDDLWAVCEFANANGADLVVFDCDANPVDGLPTYEW